jgi:uncharacterized protein YjlB
LQYEKGNIWVRKGDAILVPAETGKITLIPDGTFKVLESYIA